MKSNINKIDPGQEKWLNDLYVKNLTWCKSYVIKNQGTEQEAKDVFQDSISAAWINLQTGKFEGGKEKFSGYIRQICKYKWINELKRKGKSAIELTEKLTVSVDFESKETQFDEDFSELDILRKSIQSLGENCRKILNEFYFLKKSLAEISKKLGTTDQSIKTIKYRCMNRLRTTYLQVLKDNERI